MKRRNFFLLNFIVIAILALAAASSVSAGETTSVSLQSYPNPSVYGAPVLFTATVTAGTGIPTGMVTFTVDGSAVNSVPLDGSGTAILQTAALTAGTHAVTAAYGGDGNYDPATSPPLSHTIEKAAPAIAITSSANPATAGAVITFTAALPPDATGTVAFKDNGTRISGCEAQPVADGAASCTISSLPAAVHRITAEYDGDEHYHGEASAPLFEGIHAPSSIQVGEYHTCILASDGTLHCWVISWDPNDQGQANVPASNTGWVQVSTGGWHTCGLKVDGTISCWGTNHSGETSPPGSDSAWVAVSAGNQHSCGLNANGAIGCWGSNTFGQLSVPLPNSDWVQVSSGGMHTCGLKSDGTISCWGDNSYGQLAIPMPDSVWVQVSSGSQHTCGVKSDGTISCWGRGSYGQTAVPGPNTDWVQVSTGYWHTCGVKKDGTTACWGDTGYGAGQSTVPAPNAGWVQVSSGRVHSCGRKSDGTFTCWGMNGGRYPAVSLGAAPDGDFGTPYTATIITGSALSLVSGRLPDGLLLGGDGALSGTPTLSGTFNFTLQARDQYNIAGYREYTLVVGLASSPLFQSLNLPTSIAAGNHHTCRINADTSLSCWGTNYYGETVPPSPNADWQQVSSGSSHTCGLKRDGAIACWGSNGSGESSPPYVTGWAGLSAGYRHTCGVRTDGSIACWGSNWTGESSVPVPNGNWVQLSSGARHTCGLRTDGTISCWGSDANGESTVPVPNQGWTQVVSGGDLVDGEFTCGLKGDRTIICWGKNDFGQNNVPAPNGNWVQVSAGNRHVCGLKEDGAILCWGRNWYGETTVPSPNSSWIQVSAGESYTCGLKMDGTFLCWGYNGSSPGDEVYPRITLLPLTLKKGYITTPYSEIMTAAGGVAPYRMGIASGMLPDGISLAADGTLSGTPAVSGTFSFTVEAKDENSLAGYRSYTLAIDKLPATVSLSEMNHIFDGTAKAASATTDPPGKVVAITYTGTNGTVYGPSVTAPTEAGSYTVTAAVSDGIYEGTATGTMVIAPAIFLRSSGNPSRDGEPVTLTAAIHPDTVTTVSFREKGADIAGCSAIPVVDKVATCTTASLTAAIHRVTAEAESGGISYVSNALVESIHRIPSLEAGYYHTCVIRDDGAMGCEGRGSEGQTAVPEPNSGWLKVSPGVYDTCGIKRDGTLSCWGENGFGQTDVPLSNSDWVQVSSGGMHTCGLKSDGSIVCWGRNDKGQGSVPEPNMDWVQVSSGDQHTCGMKNDGVVSCWGDNSFGQLTVAEPNEAWVQVTAGYQHTCGIRENGALVCWGNNLSGQTSVPEPNIGWVTISNSGRSHSCGLKADATAVCWGQNQFGQTVIPGTNGSWTHIAAGDWHSCGRKTDGTIVCWGNTNPVSLTPDNLPLGSVSTAYSATLSGSGGTGPYRFSVASGTLPPGLTLSEDGAFTGLPTETGLFSFTVRVVDQNGFTGKKDCFVRITQGSQTIWFDTAPAVVVGGTGTVIATGGGSGNPVVLSSYTPSVCTVEGMTITGKSAGFCTILASQDGNSSYFAAEQVTLTFTVNKVSQSIAFGPLSAKTYGNADFSPGASASSLLPVSYRSDTPSVATVTEDGLIHLSGAGTAIITAVQAGNETYSSASAQQSLTVGKALLTVTATDSIGFVGSVSGQLYAVSYSGFASGDTAAVLGGAPAVTSTATDSSPAGSYPLTVSAGTLTSENYTFTFVSGIITLIAECPPGAEFNAGTGSCRPCAAGTFSPMAGATACIPAPPGMYVPFPGATAASFCPPGTYQELTGQSSCTAAPSGGFVSSVGADMYFLCMPGYYQDLTGQTTCKPAPGGSYVDKPGATGVVQCPAGTTSLPGSTSCSVMPAAPVITAPGNNTVLYTTTITVSGAAPPNTERIRLYADGTEVQSATPNATTGAWSLTLTLSLGSRTLTAKAENTAGIMGLPSAPVSITLSSGVSLQLNLSGSGSVTITGGTTAACNSNCTTQIAPASAVLLKATASDFSIFTGWGGACTGATDCSLTISSNTTVTASFIKDTPHSVRMELSPPSYFSSIMAAYQALTLPKPIKLWRTEYPGDLSFGNNTGFLLEGGYDETYSTARDCATIIGSVTIAKGTGALSGICIK